MESLKHEQRRKNMQAIKNKGSKIERKLALALWHKGFRYRLNDNRVFGKPDICFYALKIAIFCESEFWHGKDWEQKKLDHKSNQDFWIKKIERNTHRDIEVNRELLKNNWKVLRFWGKDIKKDLLTCINIIENVINETKNQN
jgi:DNA mismatch endonuclease Vsr